MPHCEERLVVGKPVLYSAVKLSILRCAPDTQLGFSRIGTIAPLRLPLSFATRSKTVADKSATDLLKPTHTLRTIVLRLHGTR